MDITDTLAPKSDQMDAIELTEPRMFTIERVTAGSADQPVNIHLAEFPRPWRPAKSMRRVLAHCWGVETDHWIGRRVLLYCDPRVKWAGEEIGGIRIQALSHIDKTIKVPLLASQGRAALFIVEPLPEETITRRPIDFAVTPEQVAASTDRDELRGWWKDAGDELRSLIQARVAELDAGAVDGPADT